MYQRLSILIYLTLPLCGLSFETGEVSAKCKSALTEDASANRYDAQGDPLPSGATARLGTIRLRPADLTISVAFSPDGKYIASGTDSATRDVRLWDATSGKEIALVYSPGNAQSFSQRVSFSPDGRYLAYIGEEGINLWELATKRTSSSINSWSPFAFSPDSKMIAAVIKRELVIFDLETRNIKVRLRSPRHLIWAVAFSPDGKHVATDEGKGYPFPSIVRLWNAHTGKQVAELPEFKQRVESLSFSPDSKTLAAVGTHRDSYPGLWDVDKRKLIAHLDQSANAAAFSPDGKLLASSDGGYIRLRDSVTRKQIRVIQTHQQWIRSFAFSPDGKKIVTGSGWHALQLWDVETGRQILPISGHEHTVFSLQFAPDGKTLASYGDDFTVRLWDLKTAKEQRLFCFGSQQENLLGRILPGHALSFSPDGKTLAAIGVFKEGEADNPVNLWNVNSGESIAVIHAPRRKGAASLPLALAFSRDGQALATVNGGDIQLWSVASSTQLKVLRGGRDHLYRSVEFSPDGRTLAVSELFPPQIAPQIILWDWTSGRKVGALPCRKGGTTFLAFSPSGHMLASTSSEVRRHISQSDKKIQLHEPASGTLLRTLEEEETSAPCVAFSPDGRLLASAGQHDHAVAIWDVFTGKELAKFTGHRGPVYCVAFSPDGKTVASGSADTTILLWDASKLQPEAPPAIPRNELAKELPRLWDEMQAKEGAKAYDAIWHLLGEGDEAAAFLGQKLQPVAAPDAKLLKQAITDLESVAFDQREAAHTHIKKLGELAEPALRQALQGKPSLEARKRIENLLAEINERAIAGREPRQLRALHALELIGSPAARAVFKKLAAGAPGARLTRDAKLALQRLERRPHKP